MLDQKLNTTLDQAEVLFHLAEEEFSRPEEDVVAYMVCRNAYKAVNKYLTGFLLDHGLDIHASMSLEVLLNKCQELDNRFENLNLDTLYNTNVHEQDDVYMDMDTVKEFIDLAIDVRKLVIQY
jgi:HEPN domain-containing protein